MLSIREAVAGDTPLLKTLIHEFAEFYKFPVSITEEQLLRDGFGSRPLFHVLIAEYDGAAAGYALFFDYYSSFKGCCIFLEDLFIRPQFRGKGIGNAFFERLAAIAEQGKYVGLILQVFDWNKPAVEFYNKIGATFWDDLKTVWLSRETLRATARNSKQSSANTQAGN
jgi:GNAT superfamily N-acetyltransferase